MHEQSLFLSLPIEILVSLSAIIEYVLYVVDFFGFQKNEILGADLSGYLRLREIEKQKQAWNGWVTINKITVNDLLYYNRLWYKIMI